MSTPAGWYPDPQLQGQLRYWDGVAWTEHQAPAQAAPAPAPDAGAGQDQAGGYTATVRQQPSAGYGAAPPPGSAEQTSPYDPPGQDSGVPGEYGSAYGQADPLGYGTSTGGYSPYGSAPVPKPSRRPLIIGGVLAVVGVVIVALLIVLGVRLISGGGSDETPTAGPPATAEPTDDATDEPTDDASDEPTDEPTDDATDGSGGTSEGGDLTVGGSLALSVPADGVAVAHLTLSEAQAIRVYTSSDADPMLRVLDADGTELASDDDSEYQSENHLDASVLVALAPGEYTVEVTDWSGAAADIQLLAEQAGDVAQMELGETELDVSAEGMFIGSISLEPGTYSIDVSSDADPTLSVTTPDGQAESEDDRSSDAPDSDNYFDPYLEITVTEVGEMTVLIEEYWGNALNGTVTITQQ